MRHVPYPSIILVLLLCLSLCLGGCGGGSSSPPRVNTGASATADLLWSAQKLMNAMAGDTGDLVVLDCRKDIFDDKGVLYTPYDTEHIDGAYYIDFFCFGDPYPNDQALIDQTLCDLGITCDTTICLYDAGIANPQGKVFFNLERQGCTDVHILDGGFPVWKDVGGAVSTIPTALPVPSVFVARIDNTCYAELAQMKAIFDLVDAGSIDYTLTDYREPPLYYGHKICPDAVRHGHMTHTNLLDWHEYYDSSTGLFLPAAQINAKSKAAGQDPAKTNVLICNKGWRTGLAYFALRYAGWSKAKLLHYVGGIREWTKQDPLAYPMLTEACYNVGALMPSGDKAAKRFAGAFAQIGSTVYCVGGYLIDPGPGTVSDRVQAYDIASDTWTDGLAPLPESLAFSVGAADTNNYVYVIGGIDQAKAISDKVYQYDTILDSWFDITGADPLPQGRFSYAAASIGDMIYVCGGLTSTDTSVTANYSASVYSYDTTAQKWDATTLPDLPHGRRCHTMVAIGSTLHVLGGFYFDDVLQTGIDLNDVWALDTTNLPAGWVQKADLPMDIAGHAAAVAKGKIYILGGWSVDGIKYDVMEYDPVMDSSRVMYTSGRSASIGWPRYWYFIGADGDLIASIGGFGGSPGNIDTTMHSGFTHFHQTYVYDLGNTFDP